MSWGTYTLGELFESVRNGRNIQQDKSGNGFPVTRIETISRGVIDTTRVGYSTEPIADCDVNWLRPGDLLFSHINSPERVGNVALYEGTPTRLFHGINLLRLRPNEALLDAQFGLFMLRSPEFRRQLSAFVNKAVNQASVSTTNLKSIRLRVPPLDEQRRIAVILDAADSLRAKRRHAIAKLDTITQAIFVDMFGDPLSPLLELPIARLIDVAAFVRGVTFKPADVEAEPAADSVQVMRTANVQSELDMNDVWHISKKFVKRDEQMLRPFDTLISSANSWNLVGRCCLIPSNIDNTTFGGFVTVLRAADGRLRPRYLNAWFSSRKVQATARSFGRQTTNISNLDLGQCGALTIALPPSHQQEHFEDSLDKAAEVRDSMRRELGSLDAVFSSLQQRAFRGEL